MKRYRPTVGTAQVMSTSLWWVPDTAMWFVAVWAAASARFDFEVEHVAVGPTAIVAMTAVLANGVVGSAMGIYRHRYIVASFEECAALATVAVVAAALLQVTVSLVEPYSVPRSVPVLAGMFALGGMLGVRWLGRTLARQHRKNDTRCRKVVVLGAGRTGQNLTRQMKLDNRMLYEPVALLDDRVNADTDSMTFLCSTL